MDEFLSEIKPPEHYPHKGDNGIVLVVGGSELYSFNVTTCL